MLPFAARVRRVLSSTAASYAVIVVSFLARTLQLVFFYNIRVDASYQVLATDNLLHGHGITTAQVLANDLSHVVYTPLTQWPPGYSLLLAPFYALFGHDYTAAGLTLDILAALMLLLFSRMLLHLLNTPRYLVNVFTLLYGFFTYYFYFIASSDAIAISFFMAGIYFFFALLKSKEPRRRYTVGLIFFLFGAGLIKYLFIPVVFVVPLFLAVHGLRVHRRQLVTSGLLSFFLLGLSLGGLLLYFTSLSGSVAYISAPERGFYAAHLTEIYPFLTATFIKPDTAALLFGEAALPFLYPLSQWLTLILIIFLTFILYRQARKGNLDPGSLADNYFVLTWFLSLAVTGVLMVLSLFVAKEEILPGSFWTYVEEPRYYGLVNMLIHVGVFVFYQYVQKPGRATFKLLFAGMLILLLPEFFRGIVFDLNRIRKFGKEEYSWQYEKRLQDYADNLVSRIRKQKPSVPVVIAGSSYYYNHRISLASHVPLLYNAGTSSEPAVLKTNSPVVLLVMLDRKEPSPFSLLLEQQGQKAIGTFENFSFYVVPVNPD